jgi:hypothetical protein
VRDGWMSESERERDTLQRCNLKPNPEVPQPTKHHTPKHQVPRKLFATLASFCHVSIHSVAIQRLLLVGSPLEHTSSYSYEQYERLVLSRPGSCVKRTVWFLSLCRNERATFDTTQRGTQLNQAGHGTSQHQPASARMSSWMYSWDRASSLYHSHQNLNQTTSSRV